MIPLVLLIGAVQTSCPSGTLHARMDSLSRGIDGRVGAATMVLEGGEPVAVHGDERYPMQSVYKVPIVMAMLHEIDGGRAHVDDRVRVSASDVAPVHSPITEQHPGGGVTLTLRELMRGAIVESDGTASDVLLRLQSIRGVVRYLDRIGVRNVVVATSEKAMAADPMAQYRNWTTPRGALQLMRALAGNGALAPESRALLLGWMMETQTGLHRLRGLLPSGTPLAHKTGLDRTRDGLTRARNDVGIATLPDGRHLAIAVFVADSHASEEARERVIAEIAKAAWSCHAGTGA